MNKGNNMIPNISQVTHIISHKNCPDGIASALICAAALPHTKVSFVMYGEAEYEDFPLPADQVGILGHPSIGPVQLWVDIIPPAKRAQEFADTGRCIVLDHHKGAQDVVALFGERGRFADEKVDVGVSGALLAYEHVYLPQMPQALAVDVQKFAILTGIRDTWQTQDPRWDDACAQAEYLTLMGFDALCPPNGIDIHVWDNAERFTVGHALVRRTREAAAEMASKCMRSGMFAIANTRYSSDFAEALREAGDPAQVAVTFQYLPDCASIVYSLRAVRGDTDVGAFCKAQGGGGHTKAAGFTIREPNAVQARSPVSLFLERATAYGWA